MMKYILILTALVTAGCTNNGPQDARLDAQEQRLNNYDAQMQSVQAQISALYASLNQQVSAVVSLSAQVGTLAAAEGSTQAQVDSLQALVANLQSQTVSIQSSIVTLQLQDGVVAYLDPCGAAAGYNEVLIKTSSGKIIAFFENGGQRFLTVLQQNTAYRTTDADACYFTIDSNNNLAGEHH